MSIEFTLHGSVVLDIPSLYAELNRVFMADEDWALGNSLDALDDLLYGGYGALQGHKAVTVVWQDMETSRAALGVTATIAWLQHKLDQPGTFNTAALQAQLWALQQGHGQTYFDIVLDIFASHPQIHLQPA
ncbi:ribonuclease inhibitor [Stenotrophomonas sp. CFBP 13724]|uniref:ribonuclease inhibitor n=1 Tax=Stenotrophomonas sp. CFBP 13724 TaxID=2775298 RepID=UPI0005AEE7F4|nr:ribonuclease inhibitor [Stenotrophomonas sp. CFBP 13724]KIP87200.1 ribonuclease inhibitor [Stenotrophomonas maltophilia]MBD8642483.1 ribonuclease inhibitor [Stenotrophomonas sp. CFBP 13724]